MIRKFNLTPANAGMRLDQFLAQQLTGQSRSYLQKVLPGIIV